MNYIQVRFKAWIKSTKQGTSEAKSLSLISLTIAVYLVFKINNCFRPLKYHNPTWRFTQLQATSKAVMQILTGLFINSVSF